MANELTVRACSKAKCLALALKKLGRECVGDKVDLWRKEKWDKKVVKRRKRVERKVLETKPSVEYGGKSEKRDPWTTHRVRSNLIPHVCNQGSAAEISLGGYATSETRSYDDLLWSSFLLYSKWQVSDMGLACGDNERWIWMKQHVREAHASNHLAATLNMWHIGIRQQAQEAWNRRECGLLGKTCHTWFHTSRCRAVMCDTISHWDRVAPQKTTHLFGKPVTEKLQWLHILV